jgi:hypothetical protein
MSRAGVGMVIEKLLTDERLRIGFSVDRMETIAELCLRGAELTRDEIDLFDRTDVRLWFLGDQVRGADSNEGDRASCAVRCAGENGRHNNGDSH